MTCGYAHHYGRCSHQLDDVNGNGIGGECDSCDGAPGATILANSNDLREELEGATKFGDACDPVPLYSTRMVSPTTAGETNAYDVYQRTRFVATAGIGRDKATGYGLPPSPTLDVGFRWCNCHDFTTGEDKKSLDECIRQAGGCTKNPTTGYDPPPGVTSTWVHVTTRTYPYDPTLPITPGAFPGSGADQTITRTFTGSVSLDPTLHPFGPTEMDRVGEAENLLWDQGTDVAAGRVLNFGTASQPVTTGAFWSHVPDDRVTYASSRDQAYYNGTSGVSNGGLRDNYAYVHTPAFTFVPGQSLTTCPNGGCSYWRHDMLVDPTLYNGDPALIDRTPSAGLVTCGGGCSVVGPSGTVDVTDLVGSSLAALYQDGSQVLLDPVERGYQVLATGTATPNVMSVAVPRNWSSDYAPVSVMFDGRGLSVSDGPGTHGNALVSQAALGSAPVGRTEPRYALTLKQSAIYMAGGAFDTGAQTQEIWNYDLVGAAWTRLLGPGSGKLDDPSPRNVVALGYDPSQTQLAYIDTMTVSVLHHPVPVARLVVFNTATHASRIALVVPRLGFLGQVFLTARGDGTWVLTGQIGHSRRWMAYDLALSQDGALGWNGWKTGRGRITQAPFNSSDGVFLPVLRAGKTRFERLERNAFEHPGRACDKL